VLHGDAYPFGIFDVRLIPVIPAGMVLEMLNRRTACEPSPPDPA
jgi:hypothetical protein